MPFLSLDTSTLSASVAVTDGDRALALSEGGVKSHSEQLLARVERVLEEAGLSLAEISGVAVGAGPGSFTGLRIGFATAKGLCFAGAKPLYTVSSLAALALDLAGAAGAPATDALLVPVLDAKRGEIFAGFYRLGDELEQVAPERALAPGALEAAVEEVRAAGSIRMAALLAGDGALAYRAEVKGAGTLVEGAREVPSAASVGRLAARSHPVENLAAAAPAYLRPSEAEVKYPHGNPGGPFARKK